MIKGRKLIADPEEFKKIVEEYKEYIDEYGYPPAITLRSVVDLVIRVIKVQPQ